MCRVAMEQHTGGLLCVQPADGSLVNAGVWAKELDTRHH